MRRLNIIASGLLISAVLLVGCANEQDDWEKARDNPSVEVLDEFLARYPESENKKHALLLRDEALTFQTAVDEGSEQGLRRFIVDYPKSKLQAQARKKHDALVQKGLEAFAPQYLLIIDDFGLVDLIKDPDTGEIQMRPMVQWRGPLRYALGQQGVFTGLPTYMPPDPAAEDVAIAVMTDTNLADPLQAGHLYVWRGGDLVYEWQDISTWGSGDEIAARLGMPAFAEYAALPAKLIAK